MHVAYKALHTTQKQGLRTRVETREVALRIVKLRANVRLFRIQTPSFSERYDHRPWRIYGQQSERQSKRYITFLRYLIKNPKRA